MAFDQTTRNRLQRFVNDARRVLEDSHTRLQARFGADHARTRTAATRLAAVYARLGMTAQARALQTPASTQP